MAKAILNGVSIHYRTIGAGRDVVLIHGLGANQGFWNPNLLLPLARKYRVILYDLRGHGYSDMPASGYDSGTMAEDLYRLLDHLKIGRADVIGHSYGGSVALHTAVLHPERVNSLVLCDTRVRVFQPTQCPKDWSSGEDLIQKLKSVGIDIPREEPEAGLWLLERLASHPGRDTIEGLRKIVNYMPFGGWNGGRRSAERWMELLHSTTARQDFMALAGLTVEKIASLFLPTLLICGEKTFTLPSLQGLKENLRRCRTVIVPEAGHFFPVTHPETFVGMVTQFLDETGFGERRKHSRVILRLDMSVRTGEEAFFHAISVDASVSGVMIECARPLSVGCEVEAQANAGNPAALQIPLKGVVVRSAEGKTRESHRFGIELDRTSKGYPLWANFLKSSDFPLQDHANPV
jgi:pimeloyl-ACP methyl ester carboxylesterase